MIHPTANIAADAHIGAYCVIEAHVQIGPRTILCPHVLVESQSTIGEDCFLNSFVTIGERSRIGERVLLHSHVTIGSDCFGFVRKAPQLAVKIPQIGWVEIGNDVEIGASCAIDRGTLGSTVIEDGVKLDNLCHVAHNCRIGAHSLIAAQFGTAGSTKLGKFAMIGGQVALADHLQIVDHVILGGRSCVTKDVTQAGAYTGFPLEPMKDALRTMANITRVTEMRKQLHQIMQKLNL